MVNRLNKFSHFFEFTFTISTSEVAALFFKEFFRMHGSPRTIIGDMDNKFTSSFSQTLFEMVGKNLNMSTRFHPQIDRQTEWVKQWLEGYLCNYVTRQQRVWDT